jgi:hypothetical protein
MMLQHYCSLLVALALCASSLGAAEWANVKGRFVFDGDPPKASQLVVTKDQQICGAKPLFSEDLVVNPDNKGIQNVIVTLVTKRGEKIDIHPDYEKDLGTSPRMDNLGCRFEPHVLAVRTNQKMIIGNKDPVGHNSQVNSLKNAAINPLIPANQDVTHVFKQEETIPASVRCAIHPWMSAWIVVKDHPYVAISDKDGNFELQNLPVGKWTLHIWQEKAGNIDQAKSKGKSVTWRRGRMDLTVKAGDNDLGEFAIPAKVFSK